MSVTSATLEAPAPKGPLGPAPARRPGSVRRTSSLDMTWPDGRDGAMRVLGRARDILTPAAGGGPAVLDQALIDVTMSREREILDIATDQRDVNARLQRLVGERGGGHLRKLLQQVVPEERDAGRPLYLLLDDLSGASLIAYWAFWRGIESLSQQNPRNGGTRAMTGICAGFRPGSSALKPDGTSVQTHATRQSPPLARDDDPEGWHELPPWSAAVSMRRARRIDLWRDAGLIHIDSTFQDSAANPEGGRTAVHEYALRATADATTGKLVSVEAEPRVLPYAECPTASLNVDLVVGQRMTALRQTVLDILVGTLGCTHLNDALRALAEAPVLAATLET